MARAYWGHAKRLDRDGLERHILRRLLRRRPWRPELLSAEGRNLVEARVRDWLDELLALGVAPVDLVDAAYVLYNEAEWGGGNLSWTEWVRDSSAPLLARTPAGAPVRVGPRARRQAVIELRRRGQRPYLPAPPELPAGLLALVR